MATKYPSLPQVEQASHLQICAWYLKLPSPGQEAYDEHRPEPYFNAQVAEQKPVLDAIIKRFNDGGGMTPEISKALGR